MRERIIRRLAATRLPADPAAEAEAEVEEHVLRAWFRLPLREAAVLIPVIDRPDGLHVLFTERQHNLKEHGGQISFPGGRVEQGDADLCFTALRESHEEIGLPPASVEVAGYLPAQAIITGYAAVPVIGLIGNEFRPNPDPGEVASAFEVPLSFLLDEANTVRADRVRNGVALKMWEYHWEDRRIWGATALMLRTFLKQIE